MRIYAHIAGQCNKPHVLVRHSQTAINGSPSRVMVLLLMDIHLLHISNRMKVRQAGISFISFHGDFSYEIRRFGSKRPQPFFRETKDHAIVSICETGKAFSRVSYNTVAVRIVENAYGIGRPFGRNLFRKLMQQKG
jgi:hypothetical protein